MYSDSTKSLNFGEEGRLYIYFLIWPKTLAIVLDLFQLSFGMRFVYSLLNAFVSFATNNIFVLGFFVIFSYLLMVWQKAKF